ncbi:MAG: hypothetical protein IPI31_17805 [Bacteroidetes bacterium]|nr:hypothetical protein [Bacteroidota bacterium]
MKPSLKKPVIKKPKKETDFQFLLEKTTKSVRKKAIKRNQPVAVSENGIIYLIFPDGKKVPQNV